MFLATIINLSANDLKEWPGPDFLIIGTQKGGTSSLYNYLIQHPNIAGANYKEVHFFDLNFEKGLDWYKQQFPEKTVNKLIGEASPFYLYHPLVPKRIFEAFPNTKLIILLRNPTDRLISNYFMRKKNVKNKLDLEVIFRKEMIAQRELNKFYKDQQYNCHKFKNNSFLSRGLYLDQIKRWKKYFLDNQILIIFSEELFKNPETTVNKVFKFLNLPKHKLPNYQIYNKSKNKKNISLKDRRKLDEFYAKPNKELSEYLQIKLPWS